MVDARKNGAADCNREDILKERWQAAWIWITRQRKLSMESDREWRYADGTLFGRSPALCVIFCRSAASENKPSTSSTTSLPIETSF